MTPTLTHQSYRIDEHSQRILLALLNAEGSVGTGELTQKSGFERGEYSKVKYRIDTHLKPAGFVTEIGDQGGSGRDGPRHFDITPAGDRWVAEHQDQIGELRSVDGIATDAAEALETAESAKASVQSYRKKVSRLKGRVEDVEDDMDELAGRMDDVEQKRKTMTTTLSLIRGESADEEDLDELAERVDETEERVGEAEEGLDEIQERVADLEESVDDLAAEQDWMINEIDESFEQIKGYLKKVEQERNQDDGGLLDRLSPFR